MASNFGQQYMDQNKFHTHVKLDLRHLRSLECVGMERVAKFDTLHDTCEFLHELVVDVILHVYTGASTAGLSVIETNGSRHSV